MNNQNINITVSIKSLNTNILHLNTTCVKYMKHKNYLVRY